MIHFIHIKVNSHYVHGYLHAHCSKSNCLIIMSFVIFCAGISFFYITEKDFFFFL